MKKKNNIFFLKLKIDSYLQNTNLKKTLSPFFLINWIGIFFLQIISKINVKLYPISIQSISKIDINKIKTIQIIKPNYYITIKDLQLFSFIIFFDSFNDFSILKKISTHNFKKYTKIFRIYFKD